jgi:hypothetical protein
VHRTEPADPHQLGDAATVLASYLPARIIMPARIAAGIRVNDSKGRQSGFSEDREAIRERG